MPGKFCVCREWLPPNKRILNKLFNHATGVNTSVFRFEANSMQFVIDRMNESPQSLQNIKLEQRWVAHVVGDQVNWWPSEWVSSFKHRRPVYPLSAFLSGYGHDLPLISSKCFGRIRFLTIEFVKLVQPPDFYQAQPVGLPRASKGLIRNASQRRW